MLLGHDSYISREEYPRRIGSRVSHFSPSNRRRRQQWRGRVRGLAPRPRETSSRTTSPCLSTLAELPAALQQSDGNQQPVNADPTSLLQRMATRKNIITETDKFEPPAAEQSVRGHLAEMTRSYS